MMYLPKADVFEALVNLGHHCVQGGQAVFSDNQVPAITFRVDNNSVTRDLDNEIASQDITVTVDIWADDSVTASNILSQVEGTMRGLSYQLTYSADVPSPVGALQHITTRFSTLR